MPLLLIVQIVLLGVWYTLAPELPTWLVLLPAMMMAAVGVFTIGCLCAAALYSK